MDDASILSVPADATLVQLRRAYMRHGNELRNESAALQSMTHAYVRMRDRNLAREHDLRSDSLTAVSAQPQEASEQSRRDAIFEALGRRDVRSAEQLLDAMHAHGLLRWERLRGEPDPVRLAWFLTQFGERELLSGRGSSLAALLASAEFGRDILRVPGLLPHAHRLAAFTVVENGDDTRRFLEAHPDPARPRSTGPKVRRAIARYASVCADLGLADKALGAMWSSPLALEPSPELEETVLRMFADDHRSVAKLDALKSRARPLFLHLAQAVQAWAPRDDRVWHELTPTEQEELRRLVLEMERVAAIDPYRKLLHYLPHAALVSVLCAFVLLDALYGILTLLVALVAILTLWTKGSAFVYRRAFRPLVMPHVTGRGMPPDRVIEAAWHVGHEPHGKNKIAEDYEAFFTFDQVLDTVGALHRLRASRGRGTTARLRLASLRVPLDHGE